MTMFNDASSKNKHLILMTLVHAALICFALILTYDSYKEIVSHLYDKHYLPKPQKAEIKNTFVWAMLIFAMLYLYYSIWSNKESGFLSVQEYGRIFILQAVITNLIFFSKGYHVLVVLNSSFLYLTAFLLVFSRISGVVAPFTANVTDRLLPGQMPGIPLIGYIPRIYSYFKERPATPFILIFIATLAVATFVLMYKSTKKADEIAIVAFFALFIGVGIETYRLFTYRNGNEK